jgi:hypothetical protein
MEDKKYEHWRNLTDMQHLRAECFAPKERKVLTIKEIRRDQVTSNNGEVEEKPVAVFEENVLPMVLNVTNCKTIEKLYGTGNIYEWIGKKIQVFATTTKVAGQSVPCLRIENTIPETNKIQYTCSVCGKTIEKDLYDKSVAKYGKPYCSKECYEKGTNGEKIL